MIRRLAPMARPRKPESGTVRVPKAIARKVAMIATHQDMTVPDYLAKVLGPILDRDHERMLDDLCRDRVAAGRPGKKPPSG